MQHHFAAVFSKSGPQNVRPSALGGALTHIEEGFASMRAATALLIARKERIPHSEVKAMLEVSVPLDATGTLDAVPLEFGAFDSRRPGLDLNPRVPALFWRLTARVVNSASAGHGDVLSASGADAFVGAARVAAQAACNLSLSHRRGEGGAWVRDVDVLRAAPGLERYAERRRQSVRLESELIGQVIAMTFDPLGFTLKTCDGNVRVLAHAKHEDALRALGGRHVLARVSARVNRDGHVSDANLLELDAVRSSRDPLAHFRSTAGEGRGLWSTPEAREYLASLRAEDEGN